MDTASREKRIAYIKQRRAFWRGSLEANAVAPDNRIVVREIINIQNDLLASFGEVEDEYDTRVP